LGRCEVRTQKQLLVNAEQLSEWLGLTMASIRTRLSRGQLPKPVRLNRRPRWRVSDIQEFIDKRREVGS
jgi:predicted DNA-binding transcriptional regulator AlpA